MNRKNQAWLAYCCFSRDNCYSFTDKVVTALSVLQACDDVCDQLVVC